MTIRRTVLVAVDFGDASARAVEVGGAIARHWPADLRLLHAEPQDAPAYFTHDQIEALAAQRDRLHRQAAGYLEQFGRRHTSQPVTGALIDRQAPTDAILHHAREADLVVMGTHGRRGPSRWWLGSVAERVARAIERPLLVVHAEDRSDELFRRVVVRTAPTVAGERALMLARALAAPRAGTVVDGRTERVDDGADASLVVVGVPVPEAGVARTGLGLGRLRSGPGAVLFVPEVSADAAPGDGG